LSDMIVAGLPRTAMMASSSRITHSPDSEKSGTCNPPYRLRQL